MARCAVLLASLFVVALVLIPGAPRAEGAITCGTVASGIAPCVQYIRGQGPLTPNCCANVRGLVAAASTPQDRRTACNCLKSLATKIPGVNYGIATALPGKCGTSVSYPINPSVDCSKVK